MLGEVIDSLPLETKFFVALISGAAVLLHFKFNSKAVANGPTILTTLGIFATFLGIALGLAKFDSGNIQNSIPHLLDGLKTAFWASVVGVGWALTIKFRDHLWGHFQGPTGGAEQEVGAAEILDGLVRVEHALVGGEEGSLISQLKFLRTETRDELKQLRDAQVKALEKLSEMGSKALIEALRDVIKDFNQNLTEQFGENFKQLNLAVGKLVEWQEEYRLYVEATTEKLTEIQELLGKATSDYSLTLEKASEFSRIANAVGLTLNELNARNEALREQSRALADLLLSASGSLPQIEQKIIEIARQVSDGLVANQKTMDEALVSHIRSIEGGVQKASEGVAKQAETAQVEFARLSQRLTESIEHTSSAIAKTMESGAESLRESMSSTIEAVSAANAEHNKQLAELVSRTKESVTTLDAALGEELERSLNSLGRQLTALSEKFVSDYLPLTESLRRVVETARRVNAP